MTVGVVDLEVQRLAADHQSCRPARVHGDTVARWRSPQTAACHVRRQWQTRHATAAAAVRPGDTATIVVVVAAAAGAAAAATGAAV